MSSLPAPSSIATAQLRLHSLARSVALRFRPEPPAGSSRTRPAPAVLLDLGMFALLPIGLTAYAIYLCISLHAFAVDFHQEFWPASWRLLHGLSPYDRSWQSIDQGVSYPYPALTPVAFVPFALLPKVVSDDLVTAINIAALLATLWICKVRDWRPYGLVLVLAPVVAAWQTANLTLVLGLGIAVVWRKRDNPLIAGVLLAVLISLKPFVWPVAVFLLATRRYRALAYGMAAGLLINLFAWGIVGFNQIGAYESLTRAVTNFQYRAGYTITALALRLGAGNGVAYAIGIALAILAMAACLYAGRRGDERAALTLGVAACLLATPVLWVHYFALLLVPLALGRPRLSPIWFAPLILWLCPVKSAPWQIALAFGVNALIVFTMLSPARSSKPGSEVPSPATSASPA
jgi:hypothetical protein